MDINEDNFSLQLMYGTKNIPVEQKKARDYFFVEQVSCVGKCRSGLDKLSECLLERTVETAGCELIYLIILAEEKLRVGLGTEVGLFFPPPPWH